MDFQNLELSPPTFFFYYWFLRTVAFIVIRCMGIACVVPSDVVRIHNFFSSSTYFLSWKNAELRIKNQFLFQ